MALLPWTTRHRKASKIMIKITPAVTNSSSVEKSMLFYLYIVKNNYMIVIILAIIVVLCLLVLSNKYVLFAINIYFNYDGPCLIPQKDNDTIEEGIYITPANPYILALYEDFYLGVKPMLVSPLSDYVTFTRLGTSKSNQISCDWCSMVNGLIKLCLESAKVSNLIANCPVPDEMLNYCRRATKNRKKQITEIDVETFMNGYFTRKFTCCELRRVKSWSNIYLILEQIELRWCPFKAMVEYYRNTNSSYLPINEHSIYLAGKILSKYETIECVFCNKVLNEEMDPKYMSDGLDSPMLPFYKYILSL
jgi:hypothetical protein